MNIDRITLLKRNLNNTIQMQQALQEEIACGMINEETAKAKGEILKKRNN